MSNNAQQRDKSRSFEYEKLNRQRAISKQVDQCLTYLNQMAICVLDEDFKTLAKLQYEVRVTVGLMDNEIGDLLFFLSKSNNIKKR